jgi:uncharacterized protein involved in exopolysaccharide biosynthesis
MTFTMVIILMLAMGLGGLAGIGAFLLWEAKADNEAGEEVQSKFGVLEPSE